MRKASSVDGGFPFTYQVNCYIEVMNDSTVNNIAHRNKSDIGELKAAYDRVNAGKSKLYCAFQGKYTTDLFVIDDLDAFADAFGIPREHAHLHSFTWERVTYGAPSKMSSWVHIKFACGCEISANNLRGFAEFAEKHLGWAVSTANSSRSGLDGNYTYTVTVRNSSLKGQVSGSFNIKDGTA